MKLKKICDNIPFSVSVSLSLSTNWAKLNITGNDRNTQQMSRYRVAKRVHDKMLESEMTINRPDGKTNKCFFLV